jgi:hypothetical protein
MNENFQWFIDQFYKLLTELEPHDQAARFFLRDLDAAQNRQQQHLVITHISYAANSKELRDSGSSQAWRICDQLTELEKKFEALVTFDLSPESPQQKENWLKALKSSEISRPEWAFVDLRIRFGLLFCELKASELNPVRIWNSLCNYGGQALNARLTLSPKQYAAIRDAQEKALR